MTERLFGLETEFAFAAIGTYGGRLMHESCYVNRFMKTARDRLRHLPGAESNAMFLQNGAKFYVDCGQHPEMSTPECTNPWDAVRYALAGDRIVAGLASDLQKEDLSISEVVIHKCNVDYSGTRSTWGSHESYLHQGDPKQLPEQIIPHLISRIIYCGAGGFHPTSPGLEFTLSPRVFHLVQAVSAKSTSDRGVFHTKDESLAGRGYHRLHVLCGESLCSETAAWLKVGTTALVVALIEAGLRPGDDVELTAPIPSMRRFALDPTCKARVQSVGGERVTAISIQRHYLDYAERHMHDDFMPPWAEEVCRHWCAMLDRLENAPNEVSATLDWAIKLALYQAHARRRGIDWRSLPHWTEVVVGLSHASENAQYRHRKLSARMVNGENSPLAPEVKRLTPFLQRHGLSRENLSTFLELRQELFETDTRFSQLGEKGIFTAMDRAGVLSHRFSGVDNIGYAMDHPPATGRARLRGDCVRQFAGDGARYSCDWRGVWDHQGERFLDLSEPLAPAEEWRSFSHAEIRRPYRIRTLL